MSRIEQIKAEQKKLADKSHSHSIVAGGFPETS